MIKTIKDIEDHIDFCYAYRDEECTNCNNKAFGVIYYWCGNTECCSPPTAFYCKDCLLDMYKDE